MKAISLWQPWASLIAVGAKRVETRSWPAFPSIIGQRIAIHAAKTHSHLGICVEAPFREYIPDSTALPLGAVVCTAVLDRCTQMTAASVAALEERNPHEFAFGLYTIGRHAWVLRDVEVLPEPVPFTGRQGFFDIPDETLGIVASQARLL